MEFIADDEVSRKKPFPVAWKLYVLLHIPVWFVLMVAGGIAGTAMMLAFLPVAVGICVAVLGWRGREPSAWYGVAWLLGLTGVGALLSFLSAPDVNWSASGASSAWWDAILLIPTVDLLVLFRWMRDANRAAYEVDEPERDGVLGALHRTLRGWFPKASLRSAILATGGGFLAFVMLFLFALGCACGPHLEEYALFFVGVTLVVARIMGAAVGTRRLSGQLSASAIFAMAGIASAAISQVHLLPSWAPEHRFGIPPEAWFQLACFGSAAVWLSGAIWLLASKQARQWFTPPPPPLPARRPALF